jgi:hypothetical protein
VRLPIALSTIEPNGGVIVTLPHVLQILDKLFEFCSSHVLPTSFGLIVQFESYWHPTDKRECKITFERGIRKFVDGSGKRTDGIRMLVGRAVERGIRKFVDGIGMLVRRAVERGVRKFVDGSGKRMDGIEMLVGRAVKVCYDFPDEIPLLASSGGQFR